MATLTEVYLWAHCEYAEFDRLKTRFVADETTAFDYYMWVLRPDYSKVHWASYLDGRTAAPAGDYDALQQQFTGVTGGAHWIHREKFGCRRSQGASQLLPISSLATNNPSFDTTIKPKLWPLPKDSTTSKCLCPSLLLISLHGSSKATGQYCYRLHITQHEIYSDRHLGLLIPPSGPILKRWRSKWRNSLEQRWWFPCGLVLKICLSTTLLCKNGDC